VFEENTASRRITPNHSANVTRSDRSKASYTRGHHGRATTNLGGAFPGSDNIFSSHQTCHQSWVSFKMKLEEASALILLFSRLRKRRKKRRFWIHPILKDRSTKGIFYTLYSDLRQNPDKFFIFARMSITSFDELLQCMKEQQTGVDTNMRDSIPPEEKFMVTLR
jgi:hypothetical protein